MSELVAGSGFFGRGGDEFEFEGVLGEEFYGLKGGAGFGFVAGLEEDGWVGAEGVDGELELAVG